MMKKILVIAFLFFVANLFAQEDTAIKQVVYPTGYEKQIDVVYSEVNGWQGREDIYFNTSTQSDRYRH